MKIQVVVEYDPEAESYTAHCPELPGCAICGKTEKEALQKIRGAVELYFKPAPGDVASGAKVLEITL